MDGWPGKRGVAPGLRTQHDAILGCALAVAQQAILPPLRWWWNESLQPATDETGKNNGGDVVNILIERAGGGLINSISTHHTTQVVRLNSGIFLSVVGYGTYPGAARSHFAPPKALAS